MKHEAMVFLPDRFLRRAMVVWQSPVCVIARGARLWQPLFVVLRRFVKFAIITQATYNSECFHGTMGHGRIQELPLPFGADGKNGSNVIIPSCVNCSPTVGKCAWVGGSSFTGREAKSMDSKQVRVWIPSKSGPRPHTEPTHNRLVGMALYGPAVVHCKACIFEGCFVRCGHGSNVPHCRKGHRFEFRTIFPRGSCMMKKQFYSPNEFHPRCCLAMDVAFRSDMVPTYLAYLTTFMSRNSLQFVATQSKKDWQLPLRFCT